MSVDRSITVFTSEERDRNERLKKDLIELVVSKNSLLVVGAGSSVLMGYPAWSDLLEKLEKCAISFCNFETCEKKRKEAPLEYAQEIKIHIQNKAGNLDNYYSLLNKLYEPRNPRYIDFHRILVELPFKGIITTNYDTVLEALGMDPYIGFFHQIKYGRASLSLDLTEELRHAVVDRLVLRIFNKRILTQDDFYMDDEKGGCYLKRDALKIFLKYYEEYMDNGNKTYEQKKGKSIRNILWKQAEKLRNTIQTNARYKPYLLD